MHRTTPSERPTLALCAMVNNASTSRYAFPETFRSLLPHLDEAVIGVSTQSTDDTRAQVERLQAESDIPVVVFDYPWQDDFGHMMNTVLSHTDADWRLRLHQDRRINLQQLGQIRKLVDSDLDFDVVKFWQLRASSPVTRGYTETLFRKGLHYDGIIWEHLVREDAPDGKITERFVTPDRELCSHFTYRHDDAHGGEGSERLRYHRELARRDIFRVRDLRARATTAADYFLVGRRSMILDCFGAPIGRFAAIRAFQESARLEPDEPASFIYLGDCYRWQRSFDKADVAYSRAAELGSLAARDRLDILAASTEDRQTFATGLPPTN